MKPPAWKDVLPHRPARHEWAEREETVIRTLITGLRIAPLGVCDLPALDVWKSEAEERESAQQTEVFFQVELPSAPMRLRRTVGNDTIVIAPDFDAPLSPEEEELFGL